MNAASEVCTIERGTSRMENVRSDKIYKRIVTIPACSRFKDENATLLINVTPL